MTFRRTFDPTYLNEVANHPQVRPHLGDGSCEYLDLGSYVLNRANIALEAEGGGWILVRLPTGMMDLHTLFLPEARGKTYFRQAREAMRWLFTETDVSEIVTRCPHDNPGAEMAARLVGFRPWFQRDDAAYKLLTLDEWFLRDPSLPQLALEIHALLDGAGDVPDPIHGRALAGATLMIRGGFPAKGMAFYQRCAAATNFQPIALGGPFQLHIGGRALEIDQHGLRRL